MELIDGVNSAIPRNRDQEELYERQIIELRNMYRPHGALARTLYNKRIADERLLRIDRSEWYRCDLSTMPGSIAALFYHLQPDNETNDFLERSSEKSEWVMTQLWHNVASAVLSWFLTQTSINGLLGRGSMFVFSREQFVRLLSLPSGWKYDSLLDLGAGDGATTEVMAPFFDTVYVTEISAPMRWILQRKGFTLLDASLWDRCGLQFNVVTCLNLLDRCDQPLTLLHSLRRVLAPDGVLIVALVLPFQPYVETGVEDHQPLELLPICGKTFEEQVSSVINDVFIPAGFNVERWSRLPYLCEGDLNQAFYWLSDAVFVLHVDNTILRANITEDRHEPLCMSVKEEDYLESDMDSCGEINVADTY